MGNWKDPDLWRQLCDGSACPVCQRGRPLDVAVGLPSAWLTMPQEALMPGYVCLVSRVHAVELHDLSAEQAASFMHDAQAVSRALSRVTGAVKINYEIHGNILPHLHMHFFPRYPGDPFEGRPMDPSRVTAGIYPDNQFVVLRERMVLALDSARR